MPITTELQNVRELKQVGFSDQQAEKLAELFERSQSQGFEKFAELLERRLGEMEARLEARMTAIEVRLEGMEARLEAKVDARAEGVRAEFYKSQHDLLLKMLAIFVGVVSLAVAIIKLFPNWY